MTLYGVNFNALTSMLNVATINLNFLTSEVITLNHTAALTYLWHSDILKNIPTPVWISLIFLLSCEKKKKKSSMALSRSFELRRI